MNEADHRELIQRLGKYAPGLDRVPGELGRPFIISVRILYTFGINAMWDPTSPSFPRRLYADRMIYQVDFMSSGAASVMALVIEVLKDSGKVVPDGMEVDFSVVCALEGTYQLRMRLLQIIK